MRRLRGQSGGDYSGLGRRGESGERSRSRRGRRESIGRGNGHGKAGGPRSYFTRDEQAFRSQGESEALRVMRVAIKDMIRSFRSLEYPFLRPEFQHLDSAHWSTNTPNSEKDPRYMQSPSRSPYLDDDDDREVDMGGALGKTNRFGSEYRSCGLKERWLWLRRKGDVITMSEGLSRIEVRRTAHEVGAVSMAVADIGRDVEGLCESIRRMEVRLNRVVGVRRVD